MAPRELGQRWLGSSGGFPPATKRLLTASVRSLQPVFSVAEQITVGGCLGCADITTPSPSEPKSFA